MSMEIMKKARSSLVPSVVNFFNSVFAFMLFLNYQAKMERKNILRISFHLLLLLPSFLVLLRNSRMIAAFSFKSLTLL
jgi:hypothetical protein